jgi:hypothetical protein
LEKQKNLEKEKQDKIPNFCFVIDGNYYTKEKIIKLKEIINCKIITSNNYSKQ